MSIRRAATRAAVVAWLLLAPRGGEAADKSGLPEESDALDRGTAALGEVLAHIDSSDPDTRLRARAMAKQIALDYYRSHAPEGMHLVPGNMTVTPKGVTCDGLYLGVHEVTLGEFRAFAAKQGLTNRWAEGVPDLPATNVSLEEARAYAQARGARLPTVGELSRAAHGGGRLRYPWGERFDPARVNSREAGEGRAKPVGSRARGVSVDGVADLLGNVAEWTETPAGRRHFVVAGGSYRDYAQYGPRTYRLEPPCRSNDVGFRLAKSLSPVAP